MTSALASLLVVDDDQEMCALLEVGLKRRGFAVTTTATASAAFNLLIDGEFDLVLTDLNLQGMNGIELCERVVANRPTIPVVVITAFGSLDTAVAAIRAGAYDFVTKPVDLDALKLTLERALRHRQLTDEVSRLRRVVATARGAGELLGKSPAMRAVFELIEQVAATGSSVLITGETGTGKELVARSIHERSPRDRGPFVALNCAAMPEPLLESELFGHIKGAFTDARARPGLFVRASGGTLFLDEIGELPLGLQPKLLRALQERRVRPLGSEDEVPCDVRIICATNQDLETAVEEKRFREDLFYRINVIPLSLPPLRARGGDILLLAQQFIAHFAGIAGKEVKGLLPQTADKLMGYAWPGNVRELRNCIERAVALARFDQIVVEDLPEKIRSYRPSQIVIASADDDLVPLHEVERRYILRVLELSGYNRTAAAQTLGLDRKTLYRKLKSYGVTDKDTDPT